MILCPEPATTWARFPHSQAKALLACDFFETVTLSGARVYVFAAIEHAQPPDPGLGATATQSRPGWPRQPGTWSWTSRTPNVGRGS